jgi:protein tyrosine phosphatase (PTP) superfamily phosphohydrolase (DUF442 family)
MFLRGLTSMGRFTVLQSSVEVPARRRIMRSRSVVLTLTLGCALTAGCKCFRRDPPPPCPPGGSTLIPATRIPSAPPPPPLPATSGAAPDIGPTPGGELLLPQDPPGKSRSQYPRVVPADPAPSPSGAILGDPSTTDVPKPADLGPGPADPKPTTAVDRATGIDEFARVREGVAAGRRPTLEGLDWLKGKGYKTVVHIRGPQDNDDADRRQVEKRGMKFVSLQVNPELLTQQWIDQFNEIVGDSASRPVFVYGQDPQAAGVVWYLHLRTAEFLTHDEARLQAGRLGLSDEKSALFESALRVAPKN